MNKEELEMIKEFMSELKAIRIAVEDTNMTVYENSVTLMSIKKLLEDVKADTDQLNDLHVAASIEG